MSFEVYVQFYKNGEEAGISSDQIYEVFSPFVTRSKPNHWLVSYDKTNYCEVDLISMEDTDLICGLVLSRPCVDERLWDALFSIMRQGNTVLYYPGGDNPFVACSDAIPHLPEDMVDTLGQPVVVKNGSEITKAITG